MAKATKTRPPIPNHQIVGTRCNRCGAPPTTVASWQRGGQGRTADGLAHANGTWVHESLCDTCTKRLVASDDPPRHLEQHDAHAKAEAAVRRDKAKAERAALAEAQASMGDWGRR